MNPSTPLGAQDRRFRRRNTVDNAKPVANGLDANTKAVATKSGGSIGTLLRAVRHVHQQRELFRYELSVDRLSLRVPRPKKIHLEWQRGPHKLSSDHYPTLHKNVWQCSWPRTLEMNVTLFSSVTGKGERKYAAKETTIRFLDQATVRTKSPERLGEVTFDLAEVILSGKTVVQATLPLSRCLDPTARVSLKISATKLDNESAGDEYTWSGGEDEIHTEDGTMNRNNASAVRMKHVPSLPAIGLGHKLFDDGAVGAAPSRLAHKDSQKARAPSVDGGGGKGNGRQLEIPSFGVENHSNEMIGDVARNRSSPGLRTVTETPKMRLDVEKFPRSTNAKSLSPMGSVNLARHNSAHDMRSAPPAGTQSQNVRGKGLVEKIDIHSFGRATTCLSPHSLRESLSDRPSAAHSSTLLETDGSVAKDTSRRESQGPQIMGTEEQRRHHSDAVSSDRTVQLNDKGRLIAERDKVILGLERQLLDKDRSINEKDRALIEKEKQLAQCVKQVEDLHNALQRQAAMFELDKERLVSETLAKRSSPVEVDKVAILERQLAEVKRELHQQTDQSKRSAERSRLTAQIQQLHAGNKELQKQLDQVLAKAEADRARFRETLSALRSPQSASSNITGGSPQGDKRRGGSPDSSPLSHLTKSELIAKVRRLQAAASKGDGATAVVADLEEQLVDVKVRLAQAETEKEELIEKARRRIEDLKSTTSEYASMVESLERKVADLKVQLTSGESAEATGDSKGARRKLGRASSMQQGQEGGGGSSKWKGSATAAKTAVNAKKLLRAASASFTGGKPQHDGKKGG